MTETLTALRDLSTDELDAISGGEKKLDYVQVGPIGLLFGDGLFAVSIAGVIGFTLSSDGVCGHIGNAGGCI